MSSRPGLKYGTTDGIAINRFSISRTLQRLVGRRQARALMLLSAPVSADKALQWGLATTVVPDGAFAAEESRVAAQLAAEPTLAPAATNDALNQAAGADLISAMAYEIGGLTGRSPRPIIAARWRRSSRSGLHNSSGTDLLAITTSGLFDAA